MNNLWFIYKDRDIDPHEIGIIGSKGPKDRQPFMMTFFKSLFHVNVRRTRSSKRSDGSSTGVTYYDHDEWNPYLSKWKIKNSIWYKFYSHTEMFCVSDPHDRYVSGRSCQKRELYVSFRDLGWQVCLFLFSK